MKRACIISDSGELSAQLGEILTPEGIAFSSESTREFHARRHAICASKDRPSLFFYAPASFAEIDLDLVRQLRAECESALVVVAEAPSHSAVIQTIRAGATDFIDLAADLHEEVASILASLQSRSSHDTSCGELVTVLPCGDPNDANVVSVNLAVAIAKSRGGCTLLDFHLRGGDLCHLLKLTPRHTVLDLFRMREDVDEAMFKQALVAHESGVQLLAGPELFSDMRDLRPSVGQRLITLARATSPFVILDAEDAHHAEQVRALATGDQVVLTTRLQLVLLRRTKHYLRFLSSHGVPMERVHVVAMSSGRKAEVRASDACRALAVEEVHLIPDDVLAETMCANVGRPMVLEMPRSKASKALVELSRRVTGEPAPQRLSPWATRLRAATLAATSVLCQVR